MARTLRPVAHDDRLSLVEHLTELRTRLIICIVAFVATTALCFFQNQQVLDILNRPLETTVDAGNRDPIIRAPATTSSGPSGRRSPPSSSAAPRRSRRTLSCGAELLSAADSADKLAAAAPEIRARQPVTLGVAEPFMQTLKVSMYAGLLLALPLILFQLYAFVLPAFSPREKQVALPAMLGGAVPVHWGSRVRLLHGRPARDRLPPELQHRRVRRPDPGPAVLQVRADAPGRDGAAVPDSRGDHRRHAGRDRLHQPTRAQPPLRDPDHRRRRDAHARAGPDHDGDDDGPYVRFIRGLYSVLLAAGPARGSRCRREDEESAPEPELVTTDQD